MSLVKRLQSVILSIYGQFRRFSAICISVLKRMKFHLHALKFVSTVLALVSVVGSSLFFVPLAALLCLVMQLRVAVVRGFVSLTREGAAVLACPSMWPHPLALRTTVLSIGGIIDARTVVQYLTDGMACKNIFIEYPNLTKRIETILGIDFWTRSSNFDCDKHIIQAPPHFHQNLVSSRNIKEYVSTLLHQTPIDERSPPWQLFVINGIERDMEKMTWLVLRAHHLLSEEILSQKIHLKTYFEPWGSGENLPLLAAPSAIKRLLTAVIKFTVPITHKMKAEVLRMVLSLKNLGTNVTCSIRKLKGIQQSIEKNKLVSTSSEISCSNRQEFHCCFESLFMFTSAVLSFSLKIVSNSSCKLINCFKQSYETIYAIVLWLKRIQETRTPAENIVLEASIEFYWIIRALVSSPRLAMEDLIDTWKAHPLEIWKGSRRPQSLQLTWGDGIPLKLVDDIRSTTGASLSSVLLTAASVAVTDVLKAAGVPRPATLRCTVPVSTSLSTSQSSPTLLPLDFPTGVSNSSECLGNVRNTLRTMRRYPERYLAATWLLKYGLNFLPRSVLLKLTHALTGRCPLLCSYITGPQEPISLFGHTVIEIFHLRHPADQAVLSLCVVSYCGSVKAGVQTSDWTSPYASVLPRSFESCISELAINAGVRMQPKKHRFSVLRKSRLLEVPSVLLNSFRRGRETPPPTPSLHDEAYFAACRDSERKPFLYCGIDPFERWKTLGKITSEERFFHHRRRCSEEFYFEGNSKCSSRAARRQMRNPLREQLKYGFRIKSINEKVTQETLSTKWIPNFNVNDTEEEKYILRRDKYSTNLNVVGDIPLTTLGRTEVSNVERHSKPKVLELLQLNEAVTFKSTTMPSI